jgi:hypothetical protein
LNHLESHYDYHDYPYHGHWPSRLFFNYYFLKVFQTKALTSEFTNKFSEFTFDLLERIRTPKAADNGVVMMGKQINHITNTFSEGENGNPEVLADLYTRAVSQLHEEHGLINYRRHLQHLKELVRTL